MKPLGANNAAENELTTPKGAFEKLISQCGLSTKVTETTWILQHQRKRHFSE
ncbi:hypothetical protein ACXHQO_23415 [Vibrio antiquarius]